LSVGVRDIFSHRTNIRNMRYFFHRP
jgi:hypothetical protein